MGMLSYLRVLILGYFVTLDVECQYLEIIILHCCNDTCFDFISNSFSNFRVLLWFPIESALLFFSFAGQSNLPVFERLTLPTSISPRTSPITIPVYGSPYSVVYFTGGTDGNGLPMTSQTIVTGSEYFVCNPVRVTTQMTSF